MWDEKWPILLVDTFSTHMPLEGQNKGWQWKIRTTNLWFPHNAIVQKSVHLLFIVCVTNYPLILAA